MELVIPSKEEELRIALLLIDGKREGLFLLLSTLAPKVKSILLHKFVGILTDADVDDVLLLAAQKAFDAPGDFDERTGSLGGWFYGIAYHAAVDRMRRLGGRPMASLDDDPPAPADVADDEESPLDDVTRSDLNDCVEGLGELQKKIIKADLLAGSPVDAQSLSKKLGIPKQNVYSYREKAHRALEKCLGKRGYTAETIRSAS